MAASNFINELRRRRVFRAGGLYIVAAWVVLQVLDLAFESWGVPGEAMRYVWIAALVLFPLALVFGWRYEVTSAGIVRTPADGGDVDTGLTRIDYAVLTALAAIFVISGYLVFVEVAETPVSESGRTTNVDHVLEALDDKEVVSAEGRSVAVLPFVNMSADREKEYFADGMTEEIISAVVKIPDISVPARTSVFGYKGHQGDIRAIGLELGVAHVLEGSVRSQGDDVRITAQLIKVDDGFQLWSESFDRKLENIFAVQEEIATAIAGILIGELQVEAVPNRTPDMAAYDLYLQGRALLRARDASAIPMLEQATQADPDFAPAWAALAIAYQVAGYSDGARDWQDKAEAAARHALTLDPDNVDALNALASVLRDTWRWAEAEAYFEQALAIDPQSSELLEDWAEFLVCTAQFDELSTVTGLAYAIDPRLQPLVDVHVVSLGLASRHDEALSALDEYGAIPGPNYFGPLWKLPTLLGQGDVDAAIKMLNSAPDDFIPAEARTNMIRLLTDTRDSAARNAVRRYFSVNDESVYDNRNWYVKHVLAYAGDHQYVLKTLHGLYEKMRWANVEEIWEDSLAGIRSLDGFANLLELVNLPEYWDNSAWPDVCERGDAGVIGCE
ncbi:MAG: tetratricopeptide repeat protein [Woeseiaceae bacterium]|nr:tetratricopeptide repeat protein [Woeseiaceae bacterium]